MRLPVTAAAGGSRTTLLLRSYSGGGHAPTSSSTDDDSCGAAAYASAGDQQQNTESHNNNIGSCSDSSSARHRTARRKARRSKHPSSSSLTQSTMTTLTSRRLLLVFLSVGLLFCLLDVLYILAYVMQQHDDFSNNPHNVVAATADQDVAAATVMQDAKDRAVQTLASDWIPATGGGNGDSKEPILKLLEEAVGDVDPETAERLPSAEQVADLYGREPVVLGLESCGRFQAYGGDAAEHFVSTAGTFNTGTNLMAELLIANCVMPARMKKYKTKGVRWQVLWGKHTPVDNEEFRQSHRTYEDLTVTANNMFPAVTVRDPFKWMQSMCRHSYGADWPHEPEHCPNLVPNEVDLQLLTHNKRNSAVAAGSETVNVTVTYAEFSQRHASLVEFWNDWYKAYVQASFPRLIVRFEDVVFHPKLITQTVCECAGGQINPTGKPFTFIVDSAKKGAAHGKEKTSYVDALVKYGTEAGRYEGFEAADLEYARKHLDPDLMRLFGYHYPPPSE